jgi:flagellar hook-length control protein FliK
LQKLAAGQQTRAANQAADLAPAVQSAAAATSVLATLSAAAATPGSSGPLATSLASQVSAAERQVFVQATHTALHQGTATPVTEAKALSLNLDSGASGSTPASRSLSPAERGPTGSDTQSAQPQSSANGDPALNANAQQVLPPGHDANVLQANASTAGADTSAAANAATPAIAPAVQSPATAFALQVGPASQAADTSLQPNVQAIAVSIAAQAQPGSKQFNIRLDPPELGRVDVRLMVDSTGKAQAHLAVDKPQTLELLQRDSGTLARALKDSGVQLNNNGLQFSLKGQDRQSGGDQSKGRSLAVAAAPTTGSAAGDISSSTIFASGSGVDIRV